MRGGGREPEEKLGGMHPPIPAFSRRPPPGAGLLGKLNEAT